MLVKWLQVENPDISCKYTWGEVFLLHTRRVFPLPEQCSLSGWHSEGPQWPQSFLVFAHIWIRISRQFQHSQLCNLNEVQCSLTIGDVCFLTSWAQLRTGQWQHCTELSRVDPRYHGQPQSGGYSRNILWQNNSMLTTRTFVFRYRFNDVERLLEK